jgi:hypothetical protein
MPRNPLQGSVAHDHIHVTGGLPVGAVTDGERHTGHARGGGDHLR